MRSYIKKKGAFKSSKPVLNQYAKSDKELHTSRVHLYIDVVAFCLLDGELLTNENLKDKLSEADYRRPNVE